MNMQAALDVYPWNYCVRRLGVYVINIMGTEPWATVNTPLKH
jgi:hypothetical protein